MHHRALSALALLALGALALTGCTSAAAAPPGAPQPTGITSRGTGTATATPDTATLVLGVQTRDASASAALAANSDRAAAVIGVLEGAGVARADIRTSRLAIQPTRAPESDRITGYEVTNQVTATLRDVTAAGAVVDAAAVAAGDAIRVQEIGFSVSDETAAKAQARADAVRRAIGQAEQLAEAAGVQLGPVRSVVELPGDQPVPFRTEAADARQAVPIEPGTQELRVTVEVVHGIG
ncbi:MAG TPA: SIMPL domain-containing protein [Pseudonocardia sp.]|nr:SIMPL domain-containing protein [Pseudonocardia sp.]